MNPSPAPAAKRPRTESRWLWALVVVILLLPVLLVAGVASYFRPSSDTRALRNGLIESSGVEWQPQIVLNVGGLTLGAVRTGLSFAHLDPEARAALQTVRGVEVGIYQLSAGAQPPNRVAMLAAADTAMSARGWDRVVGVMDGGDLVAVYMPANITSARRMKCCVMVFDGREMVVVSARVNPEPLIQCALNQPAVRARLQLLAKR